MEKSALLVIDLINEIIHENGALASHGYTDFIKRNNTLDSVNKLIDFSKKEATIVPIFIKVEFSSDYREKLHLSPIFKDVDKYNILKKGTWSTNFVSQINVEKKDIIISKSVVSPFYGTNLKLILDNLNIRKLIICGVSTHLAIETTARQSHDMGYDTVVIEDCCIANNEEIHKCSLNNLNFFSNVLTLDSFITNF